MANDIEANFMHLSFLSFDEVVNVMKYEPLENFVNLLENGLIEDMNALNNKGDTYFMVACDEGLVDCARVLIEDGADVDLESALHKACHKGHIDIIKLLLICGVELEEQGGTNHLPLIVACEQGDLEAVELCIERGLDINSRFDGDVLIVSYEANQMNIVAWLLEHNYDVSYVSDEHPEDNPLIRACDDGCTELVRLLLDHGADVNIAAGWYDGSGHDGVNGLPAFPLLAACRHGHVETIHLLIQREADVNLNSGSALAIAAQNGHLGAAMLLIESGACVNSSRSTGTYSALMAASDNGHIEVARLLLDKGADINLTVDENSALYLASEGSHVDVHP